MPTFLPALPDKHPMFLEKRVYQGSSGKVYPLPCTDRIAEKPIERAWKAVWIENEFLRVLVLPEIGGRIHAIQDKTNGYDLIYNQPVIKPALVGLAGPWISGGIEFNWPQHHRPATFLPVDVSIEESADGSKTVWCSDHDPMARMKGMHGICLHPGRALVELKVRACNRTPLPQTFLWWANVATRVHEGYQSFFPPDVYYVADHARRSMSAYPLAKGFYYGVNYGQRAQHGVPENERPSQFVPPHSQGAANFKLQTSSSKETSSLKLLGTEDDTRPPAPRPSPLASRAGSTIHHPSSTIHHPSSLSYAPNDLSFYANIPTPCSYMCMGSKEDFFGGYDHLAQAGIIHVANHHISPGKKQWTWGNHEFGYAWDRNLTTPDANGEYAPYIEIMAGVYTDNQPDFSFLHPGETRKWSQFWYPIQQIGPAQHANLEAAVSLKSEPPNVGSCTVGLCVTQAYLAAGVELLADGKTLSARTCDLVPGQPLLAEFELPARIKKEGLVVRVTDAEGKEIISYAPKPRTEGKVPSAATEPPAPKDIASADELYITGLHLEQYRHATRCPTLYWREALRRDPLDSRCNNAMGLWHLRRGEHAPAETHFQKAIQRLTRRNANPYDGEPFYNLGLCLRYLLDAGPESVRSVRSVRSAEDLFAEAYAAFYKATWNQAWQFAAYHALAEMDCRRADWHAALDHLDRSLRANADNARCRNLKTIVLRKLDRAEEADALLKETLALDPLDWWARHLSGETVECDVQVCLDLAHDFARAGLYQEGIGLLQSRAGVPPAQRSLPDQSLGTAPMLYYTIGWLQLKGQDLKRSEASFKRAAQEPPDYCFPARVEEIAVLEAAMLANPRDARAPYYLGNLFYDKRRHKEAIGLWQRSARLDPSFSIVWRNLGIGYFNVLKKPAMARAAYERAFRADPTCARVLFERDQLWKRLGEKPEKRLPELLRYPQLVGQRDDLSVELCALYNQTGRHAEALELVSSRKFQPWEGGEGGPLGQHVRAHLALGRQNLQSGAGVSPAPNRTDRTHRTNSPQDAAGSASRALSHFTAALEAPANLGEAKHVLANQSDILYWLGLAQQAIGDGAAARDSWLAAASFKGDFQSMSVRAFSEMTYYSALAWERLGRNAKARKLLRDLLKYARKLQTAEAKIDYFATSLPAMLLFEDDLQFRQETTALFLQAQAYLGLGRLARARSLLRLVLKRDPNHALAADLLRTSPKGFAH